MKATYKQVKDLMYFLAMEEQPLTDPVGFDHRTGDLTETMCWDSDEERVTLQDFKGENLTLNVEYKHQGFVSVIWKAKGKDMLLVKLAIGVHDPKVADKIWNSFRYIAGTIHEKFGKGEFYE